MVMQRKRLDQRIMVLEGSLNLFDELIERFLAFLSTQSAAMFGVSETDILIFPTNYSSSGVTQKRPMRVS